MYHECVEAVATRSFIEEHRLLLCVQGGVTFLIVPIPARRVLLESTRWSPRCASRDLSFVPHLPKPKERETRATDVGGHRRPQLHRVRIRVQFESARCACTIRFSSHPSTHTNIPSLGIFERTAVRRRAPEVECVLRTRA